MKIKVNGGDLDLQNTHGGPEVYTIAVLEHAEANGLLAGKAEHYHLCPMDQEGVKYYPDDVVVLKDGDQFIAIPVGPKPVRTPEQVAAAVKAEHERKLMKPPEPLEAYLARLEAQITELNKNQKMIMDHLKLPGWIHFPGKERRNDN